MKINRPTIFILIAAVFSLGFFSNQIFQKRNTANQELENPQESIQTQESLLVQKGGANYDKYKDKILFCSDPVDTDITKYFLYTVNEDGSGKTKLSDFGKTMRHPAWSKDRSMIVYSSIDDTNKDKIFLMGTNGEYNKQLTFGDNRDVFPTFSPDGKFIVYVSYRNNTPNLFAMDINGKNTKQLTFFEGKDTALWPQWSPDGSVIVYSYNKEGEDIDFRLRTVKPDGTGDVELLSSNNADLSDYDPAWSPDGKTLYFISNRSRQLEIWKVDYEKLRERLTGSSDIDYSDVGLKQISNLYGAGVSPDHRPRVSPDGEKIVFYATGVDWHDIGTNLYTIRIDGSNLTNITKSQDDDEWPEW